MNDGRFAPERKALPVLIQYAGQDIAESIEQQVQHVIEAEAKALAADMDSEETDYYKAQYSLMKQEAQSLRSQLASKHTPHEARIDQLEKELADVREQLRIAQHNAEVWKRKTRDVSDTIDTVRR
jgi:FMN phosphatase YigB (HAD superfamily)